MTALDGWYGHAAIIGFAGNDGQVEVVTSLVTKATTAVVDQSERTDNQAAIAAFVALPKTELDVSSERAGIMRFFGSVTDSLDSKSDDDILVIGHNVRKFDVLFLWQRCCVLGIPVPYWLSAARFESRNRPEHVLDIMELAGSTRANNGFGPALDHLSFAMGLPTKLRGVDVHKLWDLVLADKLGDAIEYCAWDVANVRSISRRLAGRAPLPRDMPAQEEAA